MGIELKGRGSQTSLRRYRTESVSWQSVLRAKKFPPILRPDIYKERSRVINGNQREFIISSVCVRIDYRERRSSERLNGTKIDRSRCFSISIRK